MNSPFFIVNPNAGRGQLGRNWKSIEEALRARVTPLNLAFTEGKGDALRLTRRALKNGFATIIAAGGDGTLNECLNGFFDRDKLINPKAALGLLPLGRGSDFARFLGFSRDPSRGIEELLRAKPTKIDIGRIDFNGFSGKKDFRYFINVASFGVSGVVVDWVNRAPPPFLPPKLAYLYCTLRGVLDYRFQKVRYRVGKKEKEVSLLFTLVCNGRFFGSGINVNPKASITDGKFNIAVLPQMTLTRIVTHLSDLYSGEYLKSPDVDAFLSRDLEVEAVNKGTPIIIEADGDTIGHLPAKFTVLPKTLPFLALPGNLP